jgi:hypothetical protein
MNEATFVLFCVFYINIFFASCTYECYSMVLYDNRITNTLSTPHRLRTPKPGIQYLNSLFNGLIFLDGLCCLSMAMCTFVTRHGSILSTSFQRGWMRFARTSLEGRSLVPCHTKETNPCSYHSTSEHPISVC